MKSFTAMLSLGQVHSLVHSHRSSSLIYVNEYLAITMVDIIVSIIFFALIAAWLNAFLRKRVGIRWNTTARVNCTVVCTVLRIGYCTVYELTL